MQSIVRAGVLIGTSLGLWASTDALGAIQSDGQQRCIRTVNASAQKVARAQRRVIERCIVGTTRRGDPGTVEGCAGEDSGGVVARTRERTLQREGQYCGDVPDFGYTSGANANTQAAAVETTRLREIFGADLDAALVDFDTDRDAWTCQTRIRRLSARCQDSYVRAFNRCKRRALRGDDVAPASDIEAIAACLGDDPDGRVARACDVVPADTVARRCAGQNLDALFPGCAGEDLVDCLSQRSRERADLALDATDGISDVRALVFSRTAGFRHASIEDAHEVLGDIRHTEGIRTLITENPTSFHDASLAPFDLLLFANTTGDVLDRAQQEAMQRFVRSGRGYVGVHSAADTEHTWPWYGDLVGAYFRNHPLLPVEVEVTTEDSRHPSTDALPETFLFTDEIYNFDRNPRQDNSILLTVDEEGFIFPNFPPGPSMGDDHPIAWYKEFEGARSFYTNLGHRRATWHDSLFQEHLFDGIRWAARNASYSRIVVTEEARNPLALAVTPEGRVYYVERTGELLLWNPVTGAVIEAARLEVDTAAENGLLGVALSPEFAANRFVYLYHSEPIPDPPPASGPPGENVLSRFTAGLDGVLELSSRVDILRVPSERECCHEGGSLAFAPDGSLFLSTGDNTDPFGAQGSAPLDERPGRERWNAQRTAPNPFDLRGKILRILPDGGIPAGNLFSPSGAQGHPEIFAMGTRNPFRIAVDPVTGRLFWGEVGPDGFFDNRRGPRGYDEINFADAPGDYGWPFCIADNRPYNDYDFETETPLLPFSCDGRVPALLAYDYLNVTELALGNVASNDQIPFTGRTAVAGVYYRSPGPQAPFVLPPPFTDVLLMTEWTRDLIAAVHVNPDDTLGEVIRFLPWEEFKRPIDLELGPDGALYVLEYGTAFGGDNPDARLSRVEYAENGDLSPVAAIDASPIAGAVPLQVAFSGKRSRAPGRGESIRGFLWDLDADGTIDSTEPEFDATFATGGEFVVSLTVVSSSGKRSIPATQKIVAGNAPPQVVIESPADGVVVPSGTEVVLVASGVDAEDGDVPCDALVWVKRLGHNAHSHPTTAPEMGCEFRFDSTLPDHGDGQGLFWVVEVSYTDAGGPGGELSLTGRDDIRINVSD